MLSAIQRQAPQLFTAQKLSVVSKYITHLDVLPTQYQGAQVRPPFHCTSGQYKSETLVLQAHWRPICVPPKPHALLTCC